MAGWKLYNTGCILELECSLYYLAGRFSDSCKLFCDQLHHYYIGKRLRI